MFKTDDTGELSLLHRLILEGKFKASPFSEDIPGSPDAAALANKIYDELCKASEKQKKGSGAEMQEWRRIRFTEGTLKGSYRGYRSFALINARKDRMFETASDEDKRALVKCYLSPFTCTESEIDEFLSDLKSGGAPIHKHCTTAKLRGAMLLQANCWGDSAQVTLMDIRHGGKKLDIFFGGVSGFALETEGEETDIPPTLTSVFVKSGKLINFEADFASENVKKTIKIKARSAFLG